MGTDPRIPIVVGVTGHRMLAPGAGERLYGQVREALARLQAAYPHSPIRMLNSLAEGADALCARAARDLSIPVDVPLPLPLDDYRRDFSGEALAVFDRQIGEAERVFVAPPTEPEPEVPSRDDAYRQAGLYIVRHCQVLFSLWDGSAPVSGGCGAAEMTDAMLHGSYLLRWGAALRPVPEGLTVRFDTPRSGEEATEAGEPRPLTDPGETAAILKKTDDFNREALDVSAQAARLLPETGTGDPRTDRLQAVYGAADGLSCRYDRRYLRVLKLIALCGTLLTFAFLLYGVLDAPALLLVCGLMLLLCGGFFLRARKTDTHGKHLEYRALAEAIRIQTFLSAAGSSSEVADLLCWGVRAEAPWIQESLAALSVGPGTERPEDVRDAWLTEQRDYHLRTLKKVRRRKNISSIVVRTALVASCSAYVLEILFELLCGGFGPALVSPPEGVIETARMVIKVAVGSLSAATLFVSDYYGKLSLKRRAADHEKMARLYDRALSRLAGESQPPEQILTALAREALVENANWLAFRRDDKPDIGI